MVNGCKLQKFGAFHQRALISSRQARSNRHSIDGHYTVESGVTVLHRDETVPLRVPEGRGSRLQTSAVILQENARDGILKRLTELIEVLNAQLNNLLAPCVHFFVLVGDLLLTLALDDTLNCERGDVLHLLVVELHFLIESVHFVIVLIFKILF